jgi:non-heme chloroperoxidase
VSRPAVPLRSPATRAAQPRPLTGLPHAAVAGVLGMLALLGLIVLAAATLHGQAAPANGAHTAAAWTDPSPHTVRFVTVAPEVKLEVLDWGGTGRPILFVGCYLTAHIFDDIAPKLTDRFQVYALTRRGVGASSRPATGYDPQRRAADVLDVMGAFRMEKPILIGSSCGGDILHTLGAEQPERLGGLVYLAAAEDPTLRSADYPNIPVDTANLPTRVHRQASVAFPEAERRELAERPIDPSIRKAIVEDNQVRPAYARIRVPVVAIFGTTTFEQALKDYAPANDLQRAALVQAYASGQAMLEKWQADLRTGIPGVRIIELSGAHLDMFLSHEADIIRELRAFAATLP